MEQSKKTVSEKKLAIVIPAYKDLFLEKALSSLANQTCKDFTVYVGDDASPFRVKEIVDSFAQELNLSYTRFDNNLGGSDLVGQWQRCLDLVQDEDWVCLFSDDDMMGPRCVEAFMNQHIEDSCDVVHFNLSFVDENDELVRKCPDFPAVMSSADFYSRLFKRELDARMPEFVFRRTALKLVRFDLAWRSDTATVMEAASRGGILSIPGEEGNRVLWRCSTANVSGRKELIDRKNTVNLVFYDWVETFFSSRGLRHPFSRFFRLKTLVFSLEFTDMRSFFAYGWSIAGRFGLMFRLLLVYRVLYWFVKEKSS